MDLQEFYLAISNGIGDGIQMPHQQNQLLGLALARSIDDDVPPGLAVGRFIGKIDRIVAHGPQLLEYILLGATTISRAGKTGAECPDRKSVV